MKKLRSGLRKKIVDEGRHRKIKANEELVSERVHGPASLVPFGCGSISGSGMEQRSGWQSSGRRRQRKYGSGGRLGLSVVLEKQPLDFNDQFDFGEWHAGRGSDLLRLLTGAMKTKNLPAASNIEGWGEGGRTGECGWRFFQLCDTPLERSKASVRFRTELVEDLRSYGAERSTFTPEGLEASVKQDAAG